MIKTWSPMTSQHINLTGLILNKDFAFFQHKLVLLPYNVKFLWKGSAIFAQPQYG